MLLHGIYRFKEAPIAYRADHCTRCKGPTVAMQLSAFCWIHLFFIPVIPLGRHRRWTCRACGNDPRVDARSTSSLVLVAILLALAGGTCLLFWFTPAGEPGGEGIWAVRAFLTVCCLVILAWIRSYLRGPKLRDLLARVRPASRTECLLCGGALEPRNPPRCPRCGLDRLELQASGPDMQDGLRPR